MSVFKPFNKQDRALKYSQTKEKEGTFVFSYEIDSRGARRYLVSTKETFWSKYKEDRNKNFYEVIQPGVCKLYMDLEFSISENNRKNGEFMTMKLIEKLNDIISTFWGVASHFQDVLILDSTTEQKFSVHLIFKKVCFSDNVAIKSFLAFFESKLSIEDRELFSISSRGKVSTFWDAKVYTRHRNFRLFLSTKYEKPTPLVVAEYDKSVQALPPSSDIQFAIFESSLVQNVLEESTIIEEVTNHKLQAPSSASGFKLKGSSSSPYPELDHFIKSLLKPGGFIRQWSQKHDTILYNVEGNRWCANVQREHKSNNIYYICNMMSMKTNQHCFSCVGFRGQDIDIPGSVMKWQEEFNSSF